MRSLSPGPVRAQVQPPFPLAAGQAGRDHLLVIMDSPAAATGPALPTVAALGP
jgi:hypothetical protein